MGKLACVPGANVSLALRINSHTVLLRCHWVLAVGGTLGAAVGAENCTLQPSMGFQGSVTTYSDDSWVFNTSIPWYFAEPCPGCIPMPSHNTSENYVWLDFRVTVHSIICVQTGHTSASRLSLRS